MAFFAVPAHHRLGVTKCGDGNAPRFHGRSALSDKGRRNETGPGVVDRRQRVVKLQHALHFRMPGGVVDLTAVSGWSAFQSPGGRSLD